MVIYRNDYDNKTDKMMFDLHVIRHKMQKEGLNLSKINDTAKKIVFNWKRKHKKAA